MTPVRAPILHRFGHLILLAGLTVLAGVLRFLRLDQPAIWGDEAATFMRVCGTWPQLLIELQGEQYISGFAPFHYMLYWWIGQQTTLTPFMMRLVPALAGTLMVPAIYLLARQVASIRVALLAALLTACSGYLLNYSRDAKMYMHFWLFVTLFYAFLLMWLRTRSRLAWYGWVGSGIAMMGLHTVGLVAVAVSVLLVLTARRGSLRSMGVMILSTVWATLLPLSRWVERTRLGRWIQHLHEPRGQGWSYRWPVLPLYALGLGLILIGPWVYYTQFNRYTQRIEDRGWGQSGITWVEAYNRGRTGPDLVLMAGTAYLSGWEWPKPADQSRISDGRRRAYKASLGILLVGLVVGAVVPAWRWSRPAWSLLGPEPWWRVMIWLGAMIILPAYGFYVASMKDAASPLDWMKLVAGWFDPEHPWPMRWRGAIVLGGLILVGTWLVNASGSWARRFGQAGVFLLIVAGFLGACQVLHQVIPTQRGSVWMPRYLGVVWPAVAIASAVLLLRVPTRPLRWGLVALFVGINLAQFHGRVTASEPPTDLFAAAVARSYEPDTTFRAYTRLFFRGRHAPGEGLWDSPSMRYYLTLLGKRPIWPQGFRDWNPNDGPVYDTWNFPGRTRRSFEQFILRDVRRNPRLQEIEVWQTLEPNEVDLTDRLLEQLGNEWERIGERRFIARDHWTWMHYYDVRQRTYRRKPPVLEPTIQPVTTP